MKRNLLFIVSIFFLIPPAIFSQQFQNPGFEEWEDVGLSVPEPVDWSSIKTSDNPDANPAAPVVWERSHDPHSGDYSVRLINVLALPPLIATGTMTNGRVHALYNPELAYIYTDPDDERWHTTFTARPDSLVGWYKYFPIGDDHGAARVILHTGAGEIPPQNNDSTRIVGYAVFDMPSQTIDQWTRFSVPFKYKQSGNPEYILMTFYAGNGTTPNDGSYAYFDDFLLIYGSSGIDEKTVTRNFLHFSNGNIIIDLNSPEDFLGHTFKITDLMGREIYSAELQGRTISDLPAEITEGVYVAILSGKKNFYTQKIFLKR